jgi:hypothetical protein
MRPPARSRLKSVLAPALAALALALPHTARAVEITSVRVLEYGGYVAGAFRLHDVLSPRVRGTLDRGMPLTVQVTVDIWRRRAGWFDVLVASEGGAIRVDRNAWSDDFTLQRNLEPGTTFLTLDDVEAELDRPTRVLVTRLADLKPDESYYLIFHVDVKPLTVEDLEAVEQWLSGEAKRAGKPGPGSIARLPTYLVGVLANLSGLGDETVTVRTGAFDLEDLLRPR